MNKLDAFQIRYNEVMGTISSAHRAYANGDDPEQLLRRVIEFIRSEHVPFVERIENLPNCGHESRNEN